MSFCVNTKSPQFKETASRLGISEGQLELIAHKYGNREGTYGQFPSDNYIVAQMLGTPELNADESVVKLWNTEYQQAQVFDSVEELEKARAEALKYFDESSVRVTTLQNGKMMLNVAEPNSTEEPLISYMSNNGEQIIDGKLGVNKEQLISLLGSTMYKGNVQSVAVKELLQNAFDAVKIAQSQGKIRGKGNIRVRIDQKERTVTISDNGTGMSPKIVQKAFFTIGGSYKGDNVDNRLKSGGLGLAKMAFLFSSEYVEVSTVKDGVKTYVRTNPEQIQGDNFKITTSKSNEPNGTTVTVKIPETYLDEDGEKRTIWFDPSPSFLSKPMIGNVDIEVTKVPYWGEETTQTYDKSNIPEGYTPIGKATSDFGDIEMYVAPAKDSGDITAEVLISGLHQFSKYFRVRGASKGRFKVILNILPTVGVTSAVYPINNQREGFRATVDPEVSDIEYLLNQINRSLEGKSIAATFGSAMSMDVGKVSEVKREASDKDILNEVVKEILKKYTPENKTVLGIPVGKPQENSLDLRSIRTSREAEEKSRKSSLNTSGINYNRSSVSGVDTSGLDISKPLFHNNTTMVIGEDGQAVLKEVGKLMMELKSLYIQTYKDAGIQSRYGNVIDHISKQFWGISFDKGYGGVNVNPSVINLLAINPFYQVQVYEGVDTALALTEYLTHLIIHEFNHNYASGEGPQFTGRFPATYAEFAGIGKQFNREWKNKLYILIRDNLDTFIKYHKEYEKATNLGESFEGNKLTEGKESEVSRPKNDGKDLFWNRSGENVYEDVQRSSETRQKGRRATIEEKDKPYITEKMTVAGTSKSVAGIADVMKGIGRITQNPDASSIVTIPYSTWKSLDVPYSGSRYAKTLLGTFAVMANDWNNERFDYNKRNKTISVPAYWYEVAKLLSEHKDVVEALEALDELYPEDFSENMSDYDFKIIDGFYSGDYGMLELLFSMESDLNAFVNAGMISFSYEDSRQGELFDAEGNPKVKEEKEEQATLPQQNVEYQRKSNSLVGQINNLLDSGLLATEVRDEANKVMDWISDQLTQYLENPELVWDKYYSTQPESGKQAMIDRISKMSRQELLGLLTVDKVLKHYSEEVLSRTSENAEKFDTFDDDALDKLDIIVDNLKGLVQLGYTRFLEREGFGITLSEDSETIFGVVEAPAVEQNNPDDTNGENDPDGNSKETGNQQEHWQIESRTRAILDNASAIVKQALANCYILEDNGKVKEDGTPDYDIKTDALGRNERMSQINATRSIAKWTQGALSVQDMITKLSEKEKENPWISQIITRLKDTSGKEADFQSQFFTVFNKHFQPYSVVIRNTDGTYRTSQVNAHPALDDAMSAIKVQFRLGKLTLFNSEGVDVKNLDNFKAMRDTLEGFKKITESDRADVVSLVGEILQAVGLPQPADAINRVLNNNVKNVIVIAMTNIAEKLTAEIGNKTYDPFAFKSKNSIGGYIQNLIRPFTNALEDVMVSSIYDSGKMYQSYITPSWTTKLFQKMHLDEKNFQKFILNEFATTEWFVKGVNLLADVPATQLAKMSEDQKDEARAQYIKDHASEIVRNPWLKEILNMDEKTRQEAFVHRVQLNFNKSNYMRGMNDLEYAMSVFTEFYTDVNKNFRGKKFGYYRLPMLSNKPSNEFIRFVRYSGATALAEITNGFLDIFNQELSRIQTVMMRNLKKGDEGYIKNFDERGRQFQFLDYLNEYLTGEKKNSVLGKLLRDKVEGKEVDEKSLIDLVRDEIKGHLEEKANALVAQYKANGLFEALKSVENVGSTDDEVTRAVKEFSWNDTFAQANILELLITDKAFYGGEEDLQKRLAQVHSPGLRGNWQATDYNGNSVSDGKLRVVKIADYAGKDVVLNTIANLEEVFDRKIAEAEPSMKPQWEALKESIIDAYKDVNVVDGQALISPTAYRKKAIAFGEWSQDAENTYQALMKGEYNLASLKSVFNPRKPFTYGKVNKPVSPNPNLDTPIKTLNYGVQYKDSEYLLIMADAILRGENTGRPNLLGALFDVMEETAKTNPTAGVDFIVFDSGVKAGLSGAISISDLVENSDGRDIAFNRIWSTILNQDGSYNETYVDVLNAEDYANQQTVPEHFMEHGGLQWGSQIRAIMPSDLEATFMGQPVEYEFYDDAQGKWVKIDKQGIRNEWEKTTAAMINDSVETLKEELGLNNTAYSQKDRNIILSKILQKEILSNARYGVDLLLACSVDEEGNFRIPLGDPIQSKRVEQLINSIIKNRINKQKVEGGTLVEVTNFGTSKRLERRYKDKDGNLLKSKQDYLAEGHTEAEFKKYVQENQAGIAYDECYAPAWAREVFENFVDEKGNIDVESIEMLDPDLLKMFGYRIPTEEKYSTAPYKIIGFLPKEAGDGFMQPWETTVTDGSDFDVDKKNLMRMVINLKSKIMSKKAFAESNSISDEDQLNKEYSSYRRANNPTASNILKRIGEGGSHTLTAVEEAEAKAWSDSIREKKVNKAKNTRERLDERALEKYNRDYERIVAPLEKKYNELSEKEDLSAKEERDMLKLDRRIEREIAKLDRQLEDAKAQNEKSYNESISQIESDMRGVEEEHRSNILRDKKINAIQRVLDEGIFRDSSTIPQNQRKLFLAIKQAYLDMVYETSKPTSGRGYLNNKMFNMQWAIATNASTADKMLNPGNFDVQKRMGYMAAAYRLGNHTWEQLQAMSIKELKNLVFINKNLMEFDVQTQFYKQNSVAGQILGIFAVARSAHAIFEGRNYGVLVDDTFTIAGMEFGGLMTLDKMKDRSGVNLIGKTLGSLVGASADAVKDPVLNFMNINKETVNVLNAALRLGMDFDSIALLLSTQSITDVLSTYYKNSLSKKTSVNKVVAQRLRELEGDPAIGANSPLAQQELTTDEMVRGIKEKDNFLEYKILKAFQRLSNIATSINPLTNLSRLNSVASAVGPQHIDSIMSKRKFESPMDHLVKIGENGMYEMLSVDSVFSDVPSIEAFYEAYNIVFGIPGKNRGLFEELGITTATEQFNSVLDAIPEDMEFSLMNNKKLLTSLGDFFQSYLLVQSGVADVRQKERYTRNFAKWFTEQRFKSRYPDNPFIQAIQTDVVSKEGQEDRYFLKIETTGMEQSEKDVLSAGWIQLEKDNPDLSHWLFFYNFWRGGIGFSPKTFMGLVPLQVKEKIGGYLSTYRSLPSIVGTDVFDQWVRNNWTNDSVVPRVYKIPVLENGHLIARGSNYYKVAGSPYVKMNVEGKDILFRRTSNYSSDNKFAEYEQVSPLGNNREYFEAFPSTEVTRVPQDTPATAEKATIDSDQLEAPEDNPNDVEKSKEEVQQELTEFVDVLRGDPERTDEMSAAQTEEGFEEAIKDLGLSEDNAKFDDVMDNFCK